MRLPVLAILRSRGARLLLAGAVFTAYAAFGWSWISLGHVSGSAGRVTSPAAGGIQVESAGVGRSPIAWSQRDTRDLWINLLGFVPLGALLALLWPRLPLRSAFSLCAALSFLIEAGQLVVPGHFPSVVDIALNTSGGGTGFWLAHVLLTRRERIPHPSLISPELPPRP